LTPLELIVPDSADLASSFPSLAVTSGNAQPTLNVNQTMAGHVRLRVPGLMRTPASIQFDLP
jgi:hypothetical protein